MNTRKITYSLIFVGTGILLMIGISYAATTIGTAISTGGTLAATGATTLSSTLSVADTATMATTTIDINGTEALLVRKNSDGGDVFWIDTIAPDITASGTLIIDVDTAVDLFNVIDGSTEVFTILDGGKVGISSSTPVAWLSIQGSTEQLRLGYDATNYVQFTVSSGGDLTLEPSGGDITVTGTLTVSGATTLSSTLSVADTATMATTTIDINGTEALLVRKNSDGGDVFWIDTIAPDITASGTLIVDVDTAVDLVNVIDGTTEVFTILDGGRVGLSSSTPLADLSLGGASGTSTIKAHNICIETLDGDGDLMHIWFDSIGKLATSTGACE